MRTCFTSLKPSIPNAILVAIAIGIAGTAHAAPIYKAQVVTFDAVGIQTVDGGPGFQFAHLDVTGFKNTTGSGTANAIPKHAGFTITSISPPSSATMQTSAAASTTDDFMISAADAQNNPVAGGTFTASFNADWTITLTPNGSADFGWTVSIDTQVFGAAHLSTSGSQSQTVTLPWTAGQPVHVVLSGNGFVGSNGAGNGSSATIDFSTSADWGGISGVFDSGGNPVAGFTAIGSDGVTDYSTAAPEPAALWIIAAGAASLLARRTRHAR